MIAPSDPSGLTCLQHPPEAPAGTLGLSSKKNLLFPHVSCTWTPPWPFPYYLPYLRCFALFYLLYLTILQDWVQISLPLSMWKRRKQWTKNRKPLHQVQVRHSLDVSGPISVFVSWKAEWGDLAPLQAIACTFDYFPKPLHPPSQTFHNPIPGKLSLEIKASIFLLWDSLYTHTDIHTWKQSECCSMTEWLNK